MLFRALLSFMRGSMGLECRLEGQHGCVKQMDGEGEGADLTFDL